MEAPRCEAICPKSRSLLIAFLIVRESPGPEAPLLSPAGHRALPRGSQLGDPGRVLRTGERNEVLRRGAHEAGEESCCGGSDFASVVLGPVPRVASPARCRAQLPAS